MTKNNITHQIKVRCPSHQWSLVLQRELNRTIGLSWGFGIECPWNCEREWLIIGYSVLTNRWILMWTTEREYLSFEYPEYKASDLVRESRKRPDFIRA